MPKGIILGVITLMVSAFMIVLLNPSLPGVGAFHLGSSLEPLLDGFKAIYGDGGVVLLGLVALTGLIASFHTILYAQGRQIYSLSRAGYFPTVLSITHSKYRTPFVANIAGAIVGLAVMLVIWFSLGAEQGGSIIGSVLLNMAVFGAMFSYILQAISFILLRKNLPHIERPFRSPFVFRCGADDHHRHRHAALPDPGSELQQRRAVGSGLVCRGDRLFRLCRTPSPHPVAGRGICAGAQAGCHGSGGCKGLMLKQTGGRMRPPGQDNKGNGQNDELYIRRA